MSFIRRLFTSQSLISCAGCKDPCLHPQIPASLQSTIDTGPLINTTKPYIRHIILNYGTAESWGAMLKEVGEGLKVGKGKRVMVGAYSDPNSPTLPHISSFLLFPDFKQIEISTDDIPTLQTALESNTPIPTSLNPVDLNYDIVILVCSHTQRDARCGAAGKILIPAFTNYINSLPSRPRMVVYPTSHVGGHKYAGNVIVYNKNMKGADWYGRVTACHVEAIVRAAMEGKVVQELLRGKERFDW